MPEESCKRYEIVTIEELGATLPIGTLKENVLMRDLDSRPFTMKQERALGAIRDKQRQINVAKFVSVVLSHLCTKVGHYDFAAMKESERLLSVSQMFMSDVYYAYVWLRMQAVGSEITMDLTCPNCQNEFVYVGDLNTVEVRVPSESVESLTWEYQLRDPFELRNKKVEGFKLGIARWGSLEPVATGAFNTGEAKAALIRGSVQEIFGWDAVALGSDELDDMSKFDLEGIANTIEANRFGPDMAIETNCPKCNHSMASMLDWGYDSFFSISSKSRRPT